MRSPSEERFLLDLGIEDSFSGGDFADCGAKFEIHGVLENVSFSAGFDRLAHPGVLAVHAEHEDGGFGRVFDDLPGGVQSVHAGQSAIHDDDLRMKLSGELDGFFAVSGFADDFHVGLVFEHAAEAAADQAVIIHQQDCDLLFHKTPLSLLGNRQVHQRSAFSGTRKRQSVRPSVRNARASPPGQCRAGWVASAKPVP